MDLPLVHQAVARHPSASAFVACVTPRHATCECQTVLTAGMPPDVGAPHPSMFDHIGHCSRVRQHIASALPTLTNTSSQQHHSRGCASQALCTSGINRAADNRAQTQEHRAVCGHDLTSTPTTLMNCCTHCWGSLNHVIASNRIHPGLHHSPGVCQQHVQLTHSRQHLIPAELASRS